jgi:hypothetical protein
MAWPISGSISSENAGKGGQDKKDLRMRIWLSVGQSKILDLIYLHDWCCERTVVVDCRRSEWFMMCYIELQWGFIWIWRVVEFDILPLWYFRIFDVFWNEHPDKLWIILVERKTYTCSCSC